MPYVNYDAYRLPDGKFDRAGYDAARRANGEICRNEECDNCVFLGAGDPPRECAECKEAKEADEWTADARIRCPNCGHIWEVWVEERGELYEEGIHEVDCSECDTRFKLSTQVSFAFTSPPRGKRTTSHDDDPDDEEA